MARTKPLTIHLTGDTVGDLLSATGWWPKKTYPCGCSSDRLCAPHARRRAEEHYHPRTGGSE